MSDSRREDRRRRYLSLGVGEFVAAAVFVVVAMTTLAARYEGSNGAAALWCALVPLLVILAQGGAYWLLARAWVGRAAMPAGLASLYRGFRIIDPALLALGAVGIVALRPGNVGPLVVAVAIWLFGVVEYVNYFVVRLAFPVSRWVEGVAQQCTPQLVKDLRGTISSVAA